MIRILLPLLLITAPAAAQEIPDAATAALNAKVKAESIDKPDAINRARAEEHARKLAEFEKASADVAARNAAQAAAFEQSRARYDAEMAAWRKAYGDRPAARAAPPAKAAATATAAVDDRDRSGDRMICRRFPVTGSLVKTYRSCKPASEWDRERENIRNNPTRSTGCQAEVNCG